MVVFKLTSRSHCGRQIRLLLTQQLSIRPISSFTELPVDGTLAKRLRSFDIKSPSLIQQQSFGALVNGENVVLNSETGSGKTLAYAIPIVHHIYRKRKARISTPRPSAVIILPTLELCYQVGDVFRTLLGVNVSLVSKDIALRLKGTDIVVSTPQSLAMYPYNVFHDTETIVVDEADILIDKRVGKHGNKDPLFKFMNYMLDPTSRTFNEKRQIVRNSNPTEQFTDNQQISENDNQTEYRRQFIFVGATMPDSEVKKSRKAMSYIRRWVPDVRTIRGNEAHMLMSKLDMNYIQVEDGNKLKQLVKVVSELERENDALKILVYVDTVKTAEKLYSDLSSLSTSSNSSHEVLLSDSIGTFPEQLSAFQRKWRNDLSLVHRDVSREERLFALDHFNNATRCILITTDVTARGLDFKNVDTVLQFDFAKNVTDMLHRVGRTARMGKQGKVINFVTEKDSQLASLISQYSSSGEKFDRLFSRRRGLGKALKRNSEVI